MPAKSVLVRLLREDDAGDAAPDVAGALDLIVERADAKDLALLGRTDEVQAALALSTNDFPKVPGPIPFFFVSPSIFII